MGWKKLFENFQEDCLVHDHLFVSEWNERSIYESIFGLRHQIKFLLMRSYGLEEDVFLKNIKIAV